MITQKETTRPQKMRVSTEHNRHIPKDGNMSKAQMNANEGLGKLLSHAQKHDGRLVIHWPIISQEKSQNRCQSCQIFAGVRAFLKHRSGDVDLWFWSWPLAAKRLQRQAERLAMRENRFSLWQTDQSLPARGPIFGAFLASDPLQSVVWFSMMPTQDKGEEIFGHWQEKTGEANAMAQQLAGQFDQYANRLTTS